MSNKKIGGEYGEVRANIDVEKLNKYLDEHVEAVAAPVEVKQFKVSVDVIWFRVRGRSCDSGLLTLLRLNSLDRYASRSIPLGYS